jgi:hypothetical protein
LTRRLREKRLKKAPRTKAQISNGDRLLDDGAENANKFVRFSDPTKALRCETFRLSREICEKGTLGFGGEGGLVFLQMHYKHHIQIPITDSAPPPFIWLKE